MLKNELSMNLRNNFFTELGQGIPTTVTPVLHVKRIVLKNVIYL